jgi:type II secretion system protein N
MPGSDAEQGRAARAGGLRGMAALGVRGFFRRPHPILGYAAFTVAVFVVALAYLLPHDVIATRALATAAAGAPVAVSFADVSFAFPNGYQFSGLRISPLAAPETVFTIDRLTVRTPLLGLLLARPRSVTIAGEAYGGAIGGSAELRGGRAALDLDLSDVDLARAVAPVLPPPARIGGRADVALDLTGDGRTIQSAAGTAAVTIRGLDVRDAVVRGIALPQLAFPDVVLGAQVFGPRVQVKELRAASDAVDLGLTGDVLLRDPLPQSVLNLRLTLEVRPGAPPPMRVVTALLPRRNPGEKPVYTLSGTLLAPAIR